MKQKVSLFWFRRDLRLDDNKGLYHALKSEFPVLPLFIFDSEILRELPKNDARVTFIHSCLQKISQLIRDRCGSSLAVYHGKPLDIFKELIGEYDIQHIFANTDYEPYAIKRDQAVADLATEHQIPFSTYKDQVIFEKDEIVKNDGLPYLVYTPYKKRWQQVFNEQPASHIYPAPTNIDNFFKSKELPWLTLADIGFKQSEIEVPDFDLESDLIDQYNNTRNYPAQARGTSRLGPHLRFGTISIRKVVQLASQSEDETFLSELIWREFFMQILWHFPETVHQSFKKQYDRIKWRNNLSEFEAWKEGRTGYALVDAGMRELNNTGYMHNRVRMLVASFLCKHLLIDWRWGEAYFAGKLLDYELSSNIGNWQWAAGCGVDAAPYFRIFNPITQAEKFDKRNEYIKKWVPEYQDRSYVQPVVEHKMARERCLRVFKEALDQ